MRTANFMLKCIEIGGKFMCGVKWSGVEQGRAGEGGEAGEGRLCQNGRARVGSQRALQALT